MLSVATSALKNLQSSIDKEQTFNLLGQFEKSAGNLGRKKNMQNNKGILKMYTNVSYEK